MLGRGSHPRHDRAGWDCVPPLKGDRKGLWSAKVSGRLRSVFRLRGEDVYDVDLTDYH